MCGEIGYLIPGKESASSNRLASTVQVTFGLYVIEVLVHPIVEIVYGVGQVSEGTVVVKNILLHT